MDPSVSPCQDFYRYACGGWVAKHSVPPGKTQFTVLDQMQDENQKKTREVRRLTENNKQRGSEEEVAKMFLAGMVSQPTC